MSLSFLKPHGFRLLLKCNSLGSPVHSSAATRPSLSSRGIPLVPTPEPSSLPRKLSYLYPWLLFRVQIKHHLHRQLFSVSPITFHNRFYFLHSTFHRLAWPEHVLVHLLLLCLLHQKLSSETRNRDCLLYGRSCRSRADETLLAEWMKMHVGLSTPPL